MEDFLVTMGEKETVAVDVNSDLDMMDVLTEDLVEEETVAWVEDMVAEAEDYMVEEMVAWMEEAWVEVTVVEDTMAGA
jgi:hypothetical protein